MSYLDGYQPSPCFAGRGNLCGVPWMVIVARVCCSFLGSPVAAWQGEAPEEFESAMKAQEREAWQESVDLLCQALRSQPEDGRPVRIYGAKIRRYLPRFYLGL